MNYYAVLRLGDSLVKQKLPAAEDRGICMDVRNEDPDILKVRVPRHSGI